MNAPAVIPTNRDVYRPIVARMCPGAIGVEAELRCSMLYLRDHATSAMRTCGDDAYQVLFLIEQIASKYALAPMPIEQLRAIRFQMQRLTACASGIDNFAFNMFGGAVDAG